MATPLGVILYKAKMSNKKGDYFHLLPEEQNNSV